MISVARSVRTSSSWVSATRATCASTESHTSRVARDDAHAEDRALQQILRADLGHGDVEAGSDAVPEAPHRAPLVLERARRGDMKRQPEHTDVHQSFCFTSSIS